MNEEDIQATLSAQVDEIDQPELAACVKDHLVRPRLEDREWDYGVEGQTFPCWICLEDRDLNTAIAFCDEGFGPADPWGLISIDGKHTSMGMDSGWFATLEDAVRDSMFWDGENPDGYEVN